MFWLDLQKISFSIYKFSKVLVLFSYNKIKLNRYIFAKFKKINYSDNLTKKKKYFCWLYFMITDCEMTANSSDSSVKYNK